MNDGSVSTTCAAVESESAAESTAESVGEFEVETSGDHEVVIVVSSHDSGHSDGRHGSTRLVFHNKPLF
jgi:hypothetical protein